jgi:WD40 repeat protein
MASSNICSYGTFATGGADGFVYTWDGESKKKLFQVLLDPRFICQTISYHSVSGMQSEFFSVFDCSTPSTKLALLRCLSAGMAVCSLLHPVTLT